MLNSFNYPQFVSIIDYIEFSSTCQLFECLNGSGDGATFSHGQPPSIDAHGLRCLKVSTIENNVIKLFREFCLGFGMGVIGVKFMDE